MKYSFNLTICGECTQDITTIYLHWVSTRQELWNELLVENIPVHVADALTTACNYLSGLNGVYTTDEETDLLYTLELIEKRDF